MEELAKMGPSRYPALHALIDRLALEGYPELAGTGDLEELTAILRYLGSEVFYNPEYALKTAALIYRRRHE